MKKKYLIISFFVFSLIFLISCTIEEKKEVVSCDDSPDNADCVCAADLVKKPTPYGYFCANMTCLQCVDESCRVLYDTQKFSFNGSCVDECPDRYAPFRFFDENESKHYKYCLPIKNISETPCEKYPFYDDCTCSEGLTKRTSMIGSYYCKNVTCQGYLMPDNSCVDKCPEGYDIAYAFDAGEEPFCVIEDYFSVERRNEERKCAEDSDCVWDDYETFSCCPCWPEMMNKETMEENKLWREENCLEPKNFSEWKWRLCADNPHKQLSCDWSTKEPLICFKGRCTI